MSDQPRAMTLPGTIPGLLRRCSPVIYQMEGVPLMERPTNMGLLRSK
jgi:hypothetical protein